MKSGGTLSFVTWWCIIFQAQINSPLHLPFNLGALGLDMHVLHYLEKDFNIEWYLFIYLFGWGWFLQHLYLCVSSLSSTIFKRIVNVEPTHVVGLVWWSSPTLGGYRPCHDWNEMKRNWFKNDLRLPKTTFLNFDGNLSLMGFIKGILQHKVHLVLNFIVREKVA